MSEKSIEDIEGLASIESNIWACIYRAHELFPDIPERKPSLISHQSTPTGNYVTSGGPNETPGNTNITPGGPN